MDNKDNLKCLSLFVCTVHASNYSWNYCNMCKWIHKIGSHHHHGVFERNISLAQPNSRKNNKLNVIFKWNVTFRVNELSPCKENADMSYKNSFSDRKRQPTTSCTTTASGSSIATSALDRLRYNLSPVTSYYKPLMKSFTRRDDSPNKVSKNTHWLQFLVKLNTEQNQRHDRT